MKAKLLLAAFMLSASLSVRLHAQSFITNGLVAYYPFNGNFNDASGNGYHCTNFNVLMGADRYGTPAACGQFNGSSAYLRMPSALAQLVSGAGPLTVSVWMKVSPPFTDLGHRALVEFGQPAWNTAFIVMLQFGQFGYSEWGDTYNLYSGVALGDDRWHHGVASFDGTEISLYVDGVFRVKRTVVSNRSAYSGTIGGKSDFSTEFWSGAIDDVRIYTRALTGSEIQQLYAIEAPAILNIRKAVFVEGYNLRVGSNYQLQASTDLRNWTNYGGFTATNTTWRATNYWDVDNWSSLFFRLQPGP